MTQFQIPSPAARAWLGAASDSEPTKNAAISLTLARIVADNPTAYSIDQLRDAQVYLARLLNGGGLRTERGWKRLERRVASLNAELNRRTP